MAMVSKLNISPLFIKDFLSYKAGFDPCERRGKISVSEHAFLSVICSDDTK